MNNSISMSIRNRILVIQVPTKVMQVPTKVIQVCVVCRVPVEMKSQEETQGFKNV